MIAARKKPYVVIQDSLECDTECWWCVPRDWRSTRRYMNLQKYAVVALVNGKTMPAHRYVWQLANDCEIPAGMVIHHKCFEKRCVNPDHLELCWASRNAKYSNWPERRAEVAA